MWHVSDIRSQFIWLSSEDFKLEFVTLKLATQHASLDSA